MGKATSSWGNIFERHLIPLGQHNGKMGAVDDLSGQDSLRHLRIFACCMGRHQRDPPSADRLHCRRRKSWTGKTLRRQRLDQISDWACALVALTWGN